MWWRDVLLVALGVILGLGIATMWCFCTCTHPDHPLPPSLK